MTPIASTPMLFSGQFFFLHSLIYYGDSIIRYRTGYQSLTNLKLILPSLSVLSESAQCCSAVVPVSKLLHTQKDKNLGTNGTILASYQLWKILDFGQLGRAWGFCSTHQQQHIFCSVLFIVVLSHSFHSTSGQPHQYYHMLALLLEWVRQTRISSCWIYSRFLAPLVTSCKVSSDAHLKATKTRAHHGVEVIKSQHYKAPNSMC